MTKLNLKTDDGHRCYSTDVLEESLGVKEKYEMKLELQGIKTLGNFSEKKKRNTNLIKQEISTIEYLICFIDLE